VEGQGFSPATKTTARSAFLRSAFLAACSLVGGCVPLALSSIQPLAPSLQNVAPSLQGGISIARQPSRPIHVQLAKAQEQTRILPLRSA
jgi:hypothetical protein